MPVLLCSLQTAFDYIGNILSTISYEGLTMQAVFYSHARNNLKDLIHKVCDDYDEYIITTKDDKTAVLMSYEEYSAMEETLYLLSSKNNRERLNEAVDQIENLQFTKKDIAL